MRLYNSNQIPKVVQFLKNKTKLNFLDAASLKCHFSISISSILTFKKIFSPWCRFIITFKASMSHLFWPLTRCFPHEARSPVSCLPLSPPLSHLSEADLSNQFPSLLELPPVLLSHYFHYTAFFNLFSTGRTLSKFFVQHARSPYILSIQSFSSI